MVFAYHAREKIPSLNSLWRHGCNSELLGFLLSTNAKVKKNDRRHCQSLCLKSLKCIYFKFISIVFYMLYIVEKRWFILFLILFQNYTSLKRFFLFSKIDESLGNQMNVVVWTEFWTCLHATVLLAVKYSAELNKYILLVRVICEKIPVSRTVKFPSTIKQLGRFAYPLNRYFSQMTLTNRIYL